MLECPNLCATLAIETPAKSNIEAFSLEFKDYDIAGLTPETVSSWLINHKLHSNFLEQYYSVSPN